MTLRPEPAIALLAVTGLAAIGSFGDHPRLWPLAIAFLAGVLAFTAHPVGIVAFAPLAAATPMVVGWLRSMGIRGVLVVATLLLCVCAVGMVLVASGADIPTRLADGHLLARADPYDEPWWREYLRYNRFGQNGGYSTMRRLSLGLLILTVFAWTRKRASGSAVGSSPAISSLPAVTLALGLLSLAFVPSKWPWHFGGLIAIGAVAAATEVERFVRERRVDRSEIRSLVALVAVASIALWSWQAAGSLGTIDLQEASWRWLFGLGGYDWSLVLLALIVVSAPFLLLARYGTSFRLSSLDLGWPVAAASLAAVVATAAILIIDAASAPWTPIRQNLEALRGVESCGLADRLSTNSPSLTVELARPGVRTLVDPSLAVYLPCATLPKVRAGLVELPRKTIHDRSVVSSFRLKGPFAAVPDLYAVLPYSGGQAYGQIQVYVIGDRIPGFVSIAPSRT